MAVENIRLKIGNMAKAILVTGQSYQDPKDALNEFVSNAADEYADMGVRGERIRVILRRQGRHPLIAIDDDGRGMTLDRLRELARNLFDSVKAGDDKTLGEKAIGLLAFQQLCEQCDIVTRPVGGELTHVLHLKRGNANARLDVDERRRARSTPGTTVYLRNLDPDVVRLMTQRKVGDYLRRRRGPALEQGQYVIEVIEGRRTEVILPEPLAGIRVDIAPQMTLWGRIDFSLSVVPKPDSGHRVAVVGRAGTTILDDITQLDEFDSSPWNSDQVGGHIIFPSLVQSAGRRAIVRDRNAFPVFLDAVQGIGPAISRALEKVAREIDMDTSERLSLEVRRIFGRVLKELSDLDNPMRTPVGIEPGGDGLFEAALDGKVQPGYTDNEAEYFEEPTPAELIAPPMSPPSQSRSLPPADPEDLGAKPRRSRQLPSIAPDPSPGTARSRFDAIAGVVYYNQSHIDYLTVKTDDSALLDYISTLVAKEYVVYNNSRSAGEDLAEEMVRVLVRVRSHLKRANI